MLGLGFEVGLGSVLTGGFWVTGWGYGYRQKPELVLGLVLGCALEAGLLTSGIGRYIGRIRLIVSVTVWLGLKVDLSFLRKQHTP